MNNQIKLEITCVHCLGSNHTVIYPIIDKNNFTARKRILDEDLFLYRCPHCGHYQKIAYECVYYDEKLRYIVVVGDNDKLLDKIKLDLKDYQICFVNEIYELKEKIIIYENGLDDQVIEMMKRVVRESLDSKATYKILFNLEEFVVLYGDNEVIKTYPFKRYEYMRAKGNILVV